MNHNQQNQCLLDCLRVRPSEERTARLGRLSESDWTQVIDLSAQHRVAPGPTLLALAWGSKKAE